MASPTRRVLGDLNVNASLKPTTIASTKPNTNTPLKSNIASPRKKNKNVFADAPNFTPGRQIFEHQSDRTSPSPSPADVDVASTASTFVDISMPTAPEVPFIDTPGASESKAISLPVDSLEGDGASTSRPQSPSAPSPLGSRKRSALQLDAGLGGSEHKRRQVLRDAGEAVHPTGAGHAAVARNGETREGTQTVGVSGSRGTLDHPRLSSPRPDTIRRRDAESPGEEKSTEETPQRDDDETITQSSRGSEDPIVSNSVDQEKVNLSQPDTKQATAVLDEMRRKAEMLRLRLRVAVYKVNTNQTDVPLAKLQVRKPATRVSTQDRTSRVDRQATPVRIESSSDSKDNSDTPTVVTSDEPICIPSSPPVVPGLALQSEQDLDDDPTPRKPQAAASDVTAVRIVDVNAESLHRHPERRPSV